MLESFIALDFETSYGHIPCSIGIVEFKNGEPISEYYSLIKPIDLKFNPINSRINGIYLEDVQNEREFCEIWNEIERFFHNQNIIAHNASTDISILEKTLSFYNIPKPTYRTFCTLAISKAKVNLENYKLSTLATYFKIEQNNYHNALDDAFVCGYLFNHLNHEAFEYKFKERVKKEKSNSVSLINVNRNEILSSCSFMLVDKTFLFTGRLSLFTREQAEDMVEKHGGKNISAVSKNLNYLVVGEKAGSKLKKAQDIGTIEILDEQEFLDLINQ